MGYVNSTPCPTIEVESICSPFNIRCRWLAGKFILKSLSHSNHLIFDIYYSLYLNWRYLSLKPLQSYLLSLIPFPVSTNSSSTQLNFLFMSFHMTLYYVPLMFNWVINFLTFPPTTLNRCLISWSMQLFQTILTYIFLYYYLYWWISITPFCWLCFPHSRITFIFQKQPPSIDFLLLSWMLCHHWSPNINS